MQDNSVKELRRAIDRMAKQRDRLKVSLAKDQQQQAALNSKLEGLSARYETSSRRVEEFEAVLEKYDDTISESEAAFAKVVVYYKILDNTQGLIATLDHEQQNYRSKFSHAN